MKTSHSFFLLVSLFLLSVYVCYTNATRTPIVPISKIATAKNAIEKQAVVASIASANNSKPLQSNSAVHEKLLPCTSSKFDLKSFVNKTCKKLTGMKYSSRDTTDCSGMFHRLLFALKAKCSEAQLPPFSARSTRNLARWYNDNGDFKIIRDAVNSGDLITEGAVMFYGYGRGVAYDFKKMNITDLEKRKTGINHVAVVTEVTRENDKVVSYKIFHGLNPKRKSAITTAYHTNPNRKTLPNYGCYDEPWVAVANLFGDADKVVAR